ncbi:hypothetical protein GQ607_013337 [Colletotrichum asianum]|uniref:Cytochrome P450 n=1 Tax=Colletotrichum asianum TaxID=702518 RepID=A0A8H3W2L0_9PEZI|nr:hypothetical protein GQ607_013337 [Colletotrichum asianum]
MAFILFVVLPLIACSSFSIVSYRNSRPPKNYKSVPGPKGLPLIGNTHQLGKAPQRLLQKWASENGELFKIRLGWENWVFVNSPEAVREIFDKQSAKTSGRMPMPVVSDLLSGENRLLLLTYGTKWRQLRTIVHKLLTPKASETYKPSQDFEAKQLLFDLATGNDDQESFYLHVRRYTTSVVLTSTYGRRVPAWDCDDMREIYQLLKDFSEAAEPGGFVADLFPPLAQIPSCLQWWRPSAIAAYNRQKKTWMRYWDELKSAVNQKKAPECFVKHFIETDFEKLGISDVQAGFVAGSMIEAGSETTSSALNSAILYLSAHPGVQDTANAELTKVVGDDRSPTFSDEADLPYIRAMGKEILRIRPVTNIGSPHYTTADIFYKDYFIPKNTVVAIPQYVLHYSSEKWDNPEAFDPSRYLSYPEKAGFYAAQGDAKGRDHFDFGGGRRICPGMHLAENSLFVTLAKILWAFKIEPALDPSGNQIPVDLSDDAYEPGVNTLPKPFKARFVPRNTRRAEVLKAEWAQAQKEGFYLGHVKVVIKDFPLWFTQTRFLLTFYATFSGDQDLVATSTDESGFYNLIYNQARNKLNSEKAKLSTMEWSRWIERESWKRVLGGIYVAGTLRMVIYGINPIFNASNDLEVECFHEETLWNAQSSSEWLSLRPKHEHQEVGTMRDLVEGVLSDDQKRSRLDIARVSHFSLLILTHAVMVHMRQLYQISQTSALCAFSSQSFLGQSLLKTGLESLSRCYNLLQMPQQDRLEDLDDKEIVSLRFSSYGILRAAYIRLFDITTGFDRLTLMAEDPKVIETSVAILAEAPLERDRFLLDAVEKTLEGFQIPFRMGHMLMRKTAAFRWSIEHAVAAWDAGLFVTKWVHSVEIDAINGIEPTKAENELLTAMKGVLEEADYDPEENRSFAAGLARTWSLFLQDVWVWGITVRMGKHPLIGDIKASSTEDVIQFLGIKYANLNHWFDNAKLVEYDGKGLSAIRHGPQVISDPEGVHKEHFIIQKTLPVSGHPGISGTECLNLNIAAPTNSSEGQSLPVIVFIHGGAFITGSNWWPQYDLNRIVQLSIKQGQPLIAVSINYRLGAPGFLTSDELRKEGFKSNQGHHDQRVALQYVKRYISGFGGDPHKITVIGESAGGISTSRLLYSNDDAPSQLAVLSGAPPSLPPMDVSAAEEAYRGALKSLGAEDLTPSQRVEALSRLSPEELLEKLDKSLQFLPVLDAATVPLVPTFKAVEAKTSIPDNTPCKAIFVGYLPDDASIFGLAGLIQRKPGIGASFQKSIESSFSDHPDKATRLLKAYGISEDTNDEDAFKGVIRFASDIGFQAPARSWAASFPGDSYLFELAEANPWEGPFKGYATHVLDVVLLFQNYREHLDAKQQASAEAFAADIITFAHGKAPWKKYRDGGGLGVYRNGVRTYEEGPGVISEQYQVLMETTMSSKAEDEFNCLNLDVTVPKARLGTTAGERLPVLVWIHGGSQAVTFGSAASGLCDTTKIVEDSVRMGLPIIVVAIQYRLNIFAFGDDDSSVNLALKDQALALQWVQRHVAAFGGDPKAVTLAGESAGAVYCHAHMVSKAPLNQCILASGSLHLSPPQPQERAAAFRSNLKHHLRDLGKVNLRTAPADVVVGALKRSEIQSWFLQMESSLEGWQESLGEANRLMISDVQNESVLWRDGIWSKGVSDIVSAFDIAGEHRDKLKQAYNIYPNRPSSCKLGALDFINDYKFLLPIQEMVQLCKRAETPVYRSLIDEANPWQPSNGAHHAIDLILLFGGFDSSLSPAAKATGEEMRRSWIRFIHSQEPWSPISTAAFGPFGMFQELDDTEVRSRRRIDQAKFLQSVGSQALDKVFLALAAGRISLLN